MPLLCTFIQVVKTRRVAEDASQWIDPAIYFSRLLFDLMPIENKEQLGVSVLVRTEPSKCPSLGKWKRAGLGLAEKWEIRYVSAPVAATKPSDLDLNLKIYRSTLKAEFLTFKKKMQMQKTAATVKPTNSTKAKLKKPPAGRKRLKI